MSNHEDSIMTAAEVAPRHYDAGYIALSYCISLVGSLSTLQLLHLRTSGRGLYNWYLLFGSSVTMGGIAIWSMHFIGNRATILYAGEEQLQLAYSSTFTIVSFFVPILVLLGAYSLAGSGGDEVRKIRVVVGGSFAGSSICGMHYLGDAGISNFTTKYETTRVVASVVIAIGATNVALTLFFLMRKNFTNTWWKRLVLGLVLASAVSGMHWTAASGTTYILKRKQAITQNPLSRHWVVIIVIVLSVVCCTILLALALGAGRERRKQLKRAQNIVLASVIFDDGKLMVLPDGTLPMKTITDTFSERSFEEGFGKSHHVFHWIYRTSRNWRAVVDLLPGMRRHLRGYNTIPHGNQGHFGEYSTLFQEMFCVAAKELADATHQPLEMVGVLYEDIMITGGSASKNDIEAVYGRGHGRGKVLFLVKKVDRAEATRLGTFGFRFTAPSNVYDILARTMLISKNGINTAISRMAAYKPEREALLPPGVCLGCFAVQAHIDSGFSVLVDNDATSKLPMRPLGIPTLTSAHFRFLQQYDGKTVTEIYAELRSNSIEAARSAGLTDEFAMEFKSALSHLRLEIKDAYFDNAILDSHPRFLPTASPKEVGSGSTSGTVAQLIVFKIIIPIHTPITAPNLAVVPFCFFSTQQRAYPGCPEHEVHARRTHRDFSGRIAPRSVHRNVSKRYRSGAERLWKSRRGNLGDITDSSRSPSISSEKNLVLRNDPFTSAGIMVSHSVSVDVVQPKSATERNDLGPRVAVTKLDESTENLTWCEALFKGVLQDVKK